MKRRKVYLAIPSQMENQFQKKIPQDTEKNLDGAHLVHPPEAEVEVVQEVRAEEVPSEKEDLDQKVDQGIDPHQGQDGGEEAVVGTRKNIRNDAVGREVGPKKIEVVGAHRGQGVELVGGAKSENQNVSLRVPFLLLCKAYVL